MAVDQLAHRRTGTRASHKRATPSTRNRIGYWPYLLPGIAASVLVIIGPFLMNVYFSFTKWTGIGDPRWIGLDNYTRLLSDSVFWGSFRNNVALILAIALVPTIIGLVMAATLFDYLGKKFGPRTVTALRAAFYLPQLLPVAVAGVVWGWMLHPSYGALNQILGIKVNWLGDPDLALPTVMAVMVWFQLGYPLVIFMAALQRVDPTLYEAAQIDGATWWQRFWHITIPSIRPEIYVVLLTSTVAALKVFGPIFVLTRGGPARATLVPSYFSYQNFFEKANVGYGSAIATILAVLILLITFVFLRIQNTKDAR